MKKVTRKTLKEWQNDECRKGKTRQEARVLTRLQKQAYIYGGGVFELAIGGYGYFKGVGPIVQINPAVAELAEELLLDLKNPNCHCGLL